MQFYMFKFLKRILNAIVTFSRKYWDPPHKYLKIDA